VSDCEINQRPTRIHLRDDIDDTSIFRAEYFSASALPNAAH
jgi:hypothetical protein